MRRNNKLLVIFTTILFCSCISKEQKNLDEIEVNEVLTVVKDSISEIKTINNLLDDEINVLEIKSQLDEVTTTFLSNKEIVNYPDKIKNNFFGSYTLIKKNVNSKKLERIGSMIIYDSINPYKYEKETDEFIEITLNKPGINLYNDKLKVGMSLDKLLELLGENYINNNNSLIYSMKDKKAFFKIENNLVVKIKIGIYKNDINVSKVLKNSGW